jgi:AraC-like DNA-binding protein
MEIGDCLSKSRYQPQPIAQRSRSQLCEILPNIAVHHFTPHPGSDRVKTRSTDEVRICRIGGEQLKFSQTQPSASPDSSNTMMVSLVISGICLLKQGGRDAAINPGEYAFYDSSRPFDIDIDSQFDKLVLCFSDGAIIRAIGGTDVVAAQPYGKDSLLSALIASYLLGLAENLLVLNDTAFAKLAGTALSLLVIGATETAKPRRQNSWTRSATLKRIKSYALERLDIQLSPAKVAAEIGISIRYLHALFQDEGSTFSNWLWTQRLEACRAKISSPDFAQQSIGALALEFGFSNFSHFSRRFRQAYGVSARDMRLRLFQNHPLALER